MPLFPAEERPLAKALGRLIHTNPFAPEWVERERAVLGAEFREAPAVYSRQAFWEQGYLHPNVSATGERVRRVVAAARDRLGSGPVNEQELALYEDLALYRLYGVYGQELIAVAARAWAKVGGEKGGGAPAAPAARELWERFRVDFADHFPGRPGAGWHYAAERVFAFFFQMKRAFVQTYDHIVGGSRPAARLRAAVWESVFGHDLRRYYRCLCEHMGDFPTLITGESGTGKELVARAIGRSQFAPFDPRTGRFATDFRNAFFALNLSALAPTLIESELFGHCAGAFSGAVRDRTGWLEQCDPHGAVFLDEIGEVDPAVQVKLLRVLQTRRLERLGETQSRVFRGKLLAATNRDLAAEMRAGRFRHDFYYRLCADRIETPTLREQLADHPEDLGNLVQFITREVLGGPAGRGADGEARELADEVVRWVEAHLGRDYPWPGNFRELGHCVRSVIIRRAYTPLPLRPDEAGDPARELAGQVAAGALTAAELKRRYFALVHAQAGSYEKAARRLGVDWRTVRDTIER
jgi:transcriptional regulator with AAA-type ATPase domain